jgi:hypothetical protein
VSRVIRPAGDWCRRRPRRAGRCHAHALGPDAELDVLADLEQTPEPHLHAHPGPEVDAIRRARPAAEAARSADEVGDEARRRALVDRARRPELLDAPLVHHRDAVREAQRLGLVVGDEDGRDADLAQDLAQLRPHLLAQLPVEGGEWLVEQQNARRVHEGPRQRGALLHASRELARPPLPLPLQADEGQRLIHAAPDLGLATRRSRRPKATFSNTDMCGKSA